MSFAKLIGNQRNKDILQRLLQRGRLGSTLIFAGPDGIGKRQFALTLAKAANCKNAQTGEQAGEHTSDSCDDCPVCNRIEAGVYGDVTTIAPDGQSIKIGQARALAGEVYQRPREGRQRFFIIDGADRLREEAANSMLKTLEEPPPTSTLILLTSRPDALLPTIRSRAQRLNFAPLPVAAMEKFLAEQSALSAPDAALLARLAEGRIGRATAFDLVAYRQDRNALVSMIELLAAGENRFRLLKAAEYLGKKEREDFERQLNLLTVLLRDLFLLAAGKDGQSGANPASTNLAGTNLATGNLAIINLDIVDRLKTLAPKIGLDKLMLWAERFDELRVNLRININRQLATEAALMSLIQIEVS